MGQLGFFPTSYAVACYQTHLGSVASSGGTYIRGALPTEQPRLQLHSINLNFDQSVQDEKKRETNVRPNADLHLVRPATFSLNHVSVETIRTAFDLGTMTGKKVNLVLQHSLEWQHTNTTDRRVIDQVVVGSHTLIDIFAHIKNIISVAPL